MALTLDPISAALSIGEKLIERIWPDPAQAAAAQLELYKLRHSGELAAMVGQLEINKVEAASSSLFVAGWRPFIGWTCGAAFAYKFVLAPFAVLVLTAMGNPLQLPVLDFTEMSTILLGMLGLGAMRTAEKVKGVA
jgi:hypothetical protein